MAKQTNEQQPSDAIAVDAVSVIGRGDAELSADNIPVEYVLNGTKQGYWLVRRKGPGDDKNTDGVDMQSARDELRREMAECPYDPDKEPEKYKEWVQQFNEQRQQDARQQHHYEAILPFMLECQKCGYRFHTKPQRDYSKPYEAVYEYKKPYQCPDCKRQTSFEIIIPPPAPSKWPPIRLNDRWRNHLQQHDGHISPEGYEGMIEDRTVIQQIPQILERVIVFPEDIEAQVVACAAIASWKLECFNTIPYVGFWGPEDSGKTHALRAMSMLAYHAVKAAGISAAALARVIEIYKASVFGDEIHDHLDAKNPDTGKMRGILKSGYIRGMDYTVCEREGPGLESRQTFGLKVFTAKEPFKGSLTRRCINIFMEEATPDKLDELEDLDDIRWDANEARNALLAYKLMFPDPPTLTKEDLIGEMDNGTVFTLSAGIRQIFSPILRVAKQFDMDMERIKEYAYTQELRHKQKLLESEEAVVIYYIFTKSKQGITMLRPKEIAQDCNIVGSKGHPSPMRVGHMLSGMDLKKGRDSEGSYMDADNAHNRERLKYLYRKFRVKKVDRSDDVDVERKDADLYVQ